MPNKLIKIVVLITGLLLSNQLIAQKLNGKAIGLSVYEISTRISSNIIAVKVTKGQYVKKGDVLLLLDDTLLLLDLNIAEAEANALQPNMNLAKMDFDRALEPYDRALISDVTLKRAEFEFSTAKARFDAAFAKQKKSEYLVNLTIIRSPIEGRVLSLNANEGLYINSDNPRILLTLEKKRR